VNGVAISEADFEQEMRRIFPFFSIHGNAIPKEYEQDVRRKALNNLIDTELAYQKALRLHLQITPAEFRQRVAQVRGDYATNAEFTSAIRQYFGSRAAFEAKLRHDMLLDKVFRLEVKDKSVVTPLQVHQYYTANRDTFVQPESVSFQTISAVFPKNPTSQDRAAARTRIEKLFSQAQAAHTYDAFGVLAEKFSEDEYRVMMGEHRMVHGVRLASEFQFVTSMREGEISGVIESSAGFHIVRLVKRTPAKRFTFAEVRVSIREMLMKQRLAARNKEFHERLRANAKIEVL
jgi:peptidyl-prolyl cis-trans isomerase C